MPYGYTLLEIMIAMAFCSCMLAGMNTLQNSARQELRSVYYTDIAKRHASLFAEAVQHATPELKETIQVLAEKQIGELLPQGQITSGHEDGACFKVIVLWGKAKSDCAKNQSGQSGCVSLRRC